MSTASSIISIQCEYTLLRGRHSYSESARDRTFHYTHPSGRTVELMLSYSDGRIIATINGSTWSSEVVAELRLLGRFDGQKLTRTAKSEIDPPLEDIRTSVRNLLALLKYHLRHFDLNEQGYSVKSEKWGEGNREMRDIPNIISASIDNFSNQPLNDEAYEAVQQALNSGTFPLVAMRHLHRAKHESGPHHKWIDATIAAELAVKEVISRAHPDMAPMLMELPSPPFSKLYGSLLKTYLGQESPFRNKLVKGQEKRNALVHRPGATLINSQEAIDYVADVEAAIFHLLSLLYPDDELIKQAQCRTKA